MAVDVGVRELRDHLASYLEEVRGGREVVVTERGRAVARIISIGGGRVIDQLIAEGVVAPAATSRRVAPRQRIPATEAVSPLVGEQRQ